MARNPVPRVWRVFALLWKPLRRLTEEVRQSRVALEGIRHELKILREHLIPTSVPQAAEDSGVEMGFTTNAEQVALESIYQDLSQARGGPPSEDDVIAEYARRLEMDQVAGHLGSAGLEMRGRRDYIDRPDRPDAESR